MRELGNEGMRKASEGGEGNLSEKKEDGGFVDYLGNIEIVRANHGIVPFFCSSRVFKFNNSMTVMMTYDACIFKQIK